MEKNKDTLYWDCSLFDAWPNLLIELDVLAFSAAPPGHRALAGDAVGLVGHRQALGGVVVLQEYGGGQTLQIQQTVGCYSLIHSRIYIYIYPHTVGTRSYFFISTSTWQLNREGRCFFFFFFSGGGGGG